MFDQAFWIFTTIGLAAEKRKLEGTGKSKKAKAKAKTSTKNEHNSQQLARMKSEVSESTTPTHEPEEGEWAEDWDDETWDAD